MTSDGPTEGGYPGASGGGDPTEWDPFAGDATAGGDTGATGVEGTGGYDEQPTVIAGQDPYAPPQGYPAPQFPGEATSTQTYAGAPGAPGSPGEPSSKRGMIIAIVVLAVVLALVAVILAFTLGRGGSSTTTTVA
ncbi:MAG: hypothetical protein DCC49_03685, partial [Acidobacteria bacterium]